MAGEQWSIDGEIIDTCNCEVISPCTMGSPASYGSCLGNVTWCIDEGFFSDIDLSDCIAQLAIHASAIPQQREALVAIFLGQAGGFFGEWRTMMSEVVGVRWVPIDVERKGRKRIVRIEGVLDIDAEAILGSSENENATLAWEGNGKACSFSKCHYEGP